MLMLTKILLLILVIVYLRGDTARLPPTLPSSAADSTVYAEPFSCPAARVHTQIFFPLVVGEEAHGPEVWVTSGMKRIGQTEKSSGMTCIHVYAARGEYEPFQIVVRADKAKLTNVNVSVSGLYGPNNSAIPASSITLYREHYVYVSHSSPDLEGTNRPLGAGWYPDALIPFVDPETGKPPTHGELKAVPFDLDIGKNQPIWADIFVPREAKAGDYRGRFTITSDQGLASGEFRLNVWNFELPLKPSLNSSFQFWEVDSKSAKMELVKHKLMPLTVDPKHERELIDGQGLSSRGLGFFSGADASHCEMRPSPSEKDFRAAASSHQADLFLYNYTADEIDDCPNLHAALKDWSRNLHGAGIANLVTMKPVAELYDDGSGTGRSAIDIWVVLPRMYDAVPEQISAVLRKGDQVWSYNALVQDSYSPKWQIDFAPINYRIQPGFISQSLMLTGILYWRVDLWTKQPWSDVQTYTIGANQYPGDGMLVYPGKQLGITGVVPSMRLKWLREGIEDYQYIQILKDRNQGNWALGVARTIGSDWKHWTRDTNKLEFARRQLGEAIADPKTSERSAAECPDRRSPSPSC
jgi:hypothetical protein